MLCGASFGMTVWGAATFFRTESTQAQNDTVRYGVINHR